MRFGGTGLYDLRFGLPFNASSSLELVSREDRSILLQEEVYL